MPCFRTSYATLQSVLRHRCGVAVVVSDKPFTGQEVIGTQTHGVGFLAVGAFAVRLFLLGFPALSRHYRYDRCMDVRRVFVHVQHCRNGVLPAECAVQPLQVVIAPFTQPAFVLHSHHIFMRTRKHDADCPYLVGSNFSSDACRVDAVAYRFGAVCHTVGELHQFTVEMGACGVGVLGHCFAFYVVGCARVSRPFRLVDLDAYVSHVCFLFFWFYKLFVGIRPPAVVPHGANGGVQRGVTPLAHWGVFSISVSGA